MAQSDAFALQKSGLNSFLFAEVGTELNGSPLTILSVLARLGKDPWAEAARWARLPKAAMIDSLAKCIAQMPLGPQALLDARATAGRLILLLPGQAPGAAAAAAPVQVSGGPDGATKIPPWLALAIGLAVLAAGVGITAGAANKAAAPGGAPASQAADRSDITAK
jgi:hypothetical protein